MMVDEQRSTVTGALGLTSPSGGSRCGSPLRGLRRLAILWMPFVVSLITDNSEGLLYSCLRREPFRVRKPLHPDEMRRLDDNCT